MPPQKPGTNWTKWGLIAAFVAALLIAAGGGLLYWRSQKVIVGTEEIVNPDGKTTAQKSDEQVMTAGNANGLQATQEEQTQESVENTSNEEEVETINPGKSDEETSKKEEEYKEDKKENEYSENHDKQKNNSNERPDWLDGTWVWRDSRLFISGNHITETINGKTHSGRCTYRNGTLSVYYNDERGLETTYDVDLNRRLLDSGNGFYRKTHRRH